MFKQSLIAATIAVAAYASPVLAQPQSGLVNVSIADVSILNNFLNESQIAALNNLSVPVTVQVPVGVAANVCGVSAAVLGQAGSAAACEAKTGSDALAQVVNRQLLSQKR